MHNLHRTHGLRMLGLFGFLWLLTAGVNAQDQAASLQDRLGNLPVRHNGRLTTLRGMAKSCLRFASWKDELLIDGQVLDPVELLLDFAVQKPSSKEVPLFRIGDRKLAELHGLSPKEGETSWFVSYGQVIERRDAIEAFYGKGVVTPELNALGSQLTPFVYATSWVRAVPTDSSGNGWAAMDETPWPTGKGARYFRRLILAYASEEPNRLESALARYERWIEKAGFLDPCYTFEVPKGWVEYGVRDPHRHHFNDTLNFGRKVTSFCMGPDRQCSGGVVFFSGDTDMRNSENYCRFMSGLPPLPRDESVPKVFVNELGIKHEGAFSIHVEPLNDLPGYGNPSLEAVWTNGAGTWVATLTGLGEQVEAERDRFVDFCNSIQVGAREDVLAWLPDEPCDPVDSPYEGTGRTVALLASDQFLWIIHLYHGPLDDKLNERIEELLDSIIWSEVDGPATLVLRENSSTIWRERPGIPECVKAWGCLDKSAGIMAIVSRMKICPSDRWRDCTNVLCGIFAATPWTAEQWNANREIVGTDAGEVLVIRRD